jgi:hypothetical protein
MKSKLRQIMNIIFNRLNVEIEKQINIKTRHSKMILI